MTATLAPWSGTPIKVVPGLELTIKAMRWGAGWEFDCPTAIIAPVFRAYEDGLSIEQAVEDLLIDACVDGELKGNNPKFWAEFRGWNMAYLKRHFYRKHTQRQTLRVRFILDEDGELSWEEIPLKAASLPAKRELWRQG